MSKNHAGSSKACGTASYGSLNKDKGKNTSKHSKIIMIDNDKGKSAKVAPIAKAASVLTQSFISIMISANTVKKHYAKIKKLKRLYLK